MQEALISTYGHQENRPTKRRRLLTDIEQMSPSVQRYHIRATNSSNSSNCRQMNHLKTAKILCQTRSPSVARAVEETLTASDDDSDLENPEDGRDLTQRLSQTYI